ncbi:unnamed protein product [Haemonchus placei]|uniref:Uncharacterized protein n=1 Tax=Haemonchus placei TaxID=6290 RepID=A0A0N4W6K9_HAEPC|nr:unnamed protein product [Haemonchus placei]
MQSASISLLWKERCSDSSYERKCRKGEIWSFCRRIKIEDFVLTSRNWRRGGPICDIVMTGSVSRNRAMLSPLLSYCPRDLSPLKSAANTAPTKRYRHRGNVLELFEKPKPTSQPTPEVTPRSLFMSSSNGDIHKCIINVSQDNDYGYEQIRSGISFHTPSHILNYFKLIYTSIFVLHFRVIFFLHAVDNI